MHYLYGLKPRERSFILRDDMIYLDKILS